MTSFHPRKLKKLKIKKKKRKRKEEGVILLPLTLNKPEASLVPFPFLILSWVKTTPQPSLSLSQLSHLHLTDPPGCSKWGGPTCVPIYQ